MRVWVQSATAAGNDPLWQGYRETVEAHLRALAAPGSAFELHGVGVMTPALEDYYYPEFLNTGQILENALVAQREGYDAFAVTCMFDPGYHELRELLDIPVLAAGECAMHLACMLGGSFAFVSHNPMIMPRMERNATLYGLRERLRPPVTFRTSLEDLARAFSGGGEPILAAFHAAAERAAEQGVEVLVPACNVLNAFLRKHAVKDVRGMVILDPYAVLVKQCEMLVELRRKVGLGLSRRRHFAAPDPGLVRQVRKVYGLEG